MNRYFLGILLASPLAAAEIDFNRDVRPILSDTCFKCHGPGENKGEQNGLVVIR